MASLGAAGTKKPRRKRQVLTVEDRERNKRKAEDSRWSAAKTYDAKAWINPTRLLKEVFAGEEDILVLKVGLATRREICYKSESMNLHFEELDIESDPDSAPDCWVVVGRDRMAVAENVREIQRRSQRSAQLARDREEEDDDDDGDRSEDHGNAGHEGEEEEEEEEGVDHERNLDPRLGGSYGQQEADGQPAVSERQILNEGSMDEARIGRNQDPEPAADEATDDHHDAKQPDHINIHEDTHEGEPDLQPALKVQDEPEKDDQHLSRETESKPHYEPAEAEKTHGDHSEAEQDRTADWVTQHAAPYRSPSPESLNPTGEWHITSEGIIEKYGQSADLHLSLYITPTHPQNDNDTDDFPSDSTGNQNPTDDDLDDADLTPEQRQRKGTFQMWAKFSFGLYHGVMRFLPPTAVPTTHKRSIFDLKPHQLPSVTNTTFQYKWRGRDVTDEVIDIEAEKATQWMKFESDGTGLTGVFESDVLDENRFEGKKVGVCEGQKSEVGRLWSQVSAQAHDYEK